jgi:hypothetical protein
MTRIFEYHWGKWVDSDTAITGVYGINQLADWFWQEDDICMDCEEAYSQEDIDTTPADDCEYDENDEPIEYWSDFIIECDGSHTKLVGDWLEYTGPDIKKHEHECYFIVNGTGYTPNKQGEWAGILRETTVQIVWSIYTARAALCSPCYPGQADAGSDGEFLHYALPEDLIYKGE